MGCLTPDIPAPPGPSAEETELQKIQLEQYRKAIAEDEATRAAIEAATGKPYAQTMADVTKSSLDLNAAALERYQKALRGELDVDPTLERSLQEEEQNLRAQMLRQFGPGWETSTPGIQALAEYKKRANELRHSARRGEITAAEQQGYAMNPATWVPGALANRTATPNAADLLQQYRLSRQGQYGMDLNAAKLQGASDPWANLLGIGAGSAATGLGKMAAPAIWGGMKAAGGALLGMI